MQGILCFFYSLPHCARSLKPETFWDSFNVHPLDPHSSPRFNDWWSMTPFITSLHHNQFNAILRITTFLTDRTSTNAMKWSTVIIYITAYLHTNKMNQSFDWKDVLLELGKQTLKLFWKLFSYIRQCQVYCPISCTLLIKWKTQNLLSKSTLKTVWMDALLYSSTIVL